MSDPRLSAQEVTTIEAKSMREALKEVRRVLGADAIILDQEHFPNGVCIKATNDMAIAGRWQNGSAQSGNVLQGRGQHGNGPIETAQNARENHLVSKDPEVAEGLAPIRDLGVLPGASDESAFEEPHTEMQQAPIGRSQSGSMDSFEHGMFAHVLETQLPQDASARVAEVALNHSATVEHTRRQGRAESDRNTHSVQSNRLPETFSDLGYTAHDLDLAGNVNTLQELRRALLTDLQLHSTPGTLTGRFLFTGAPGCGKTTFMLKQLVASLQYLQPAQIAVLNCAQHKLGASEPVALACQIFDVQMIDVSLDQLSDQLDALHDKKLILIDGAEIDQTPIIQSPISKVWVVSALLHPKYLKQSWQQQQRQFRPQYVALTNMDLVPDPDDLLRRLHQWRLSVLGVNTSAEFTQDLPDLSFDALESLLFSQHETAQSSLQMAV